MQPSQRLIHRRFSYLVWLLGLTMLVFLPSCGPASSDKTPNLEPHASEAGPPQSQAILQETPLTHQDKVSTATRPLSLALGGDTGSASGGMATKGEDGLPAVSESARLAETLVLPNWIAQGLDSPKVSVRLGALDRWAQQGAQASLDPLIVALDNDDKDVRAKAMAIIEQHWAVAQEAEQ